MKFRRKLRSRIIISFLLFGTLLSGLFALTALGMREYLEDTLIADTMSSDLASFMDNPQIGGFSSRYYAWTARPPARVESLRSALPADAELRARARELIALPTGSHELRTERHEYKIAVDKRPHLWGYVIYDATPDPREDYLLFSLLLGSFVAISVLAYFLARWSATRVMAPVTDLARRIDRMGSQAEHQALAPNYADDEVGQLAAALDSYAERLTALVMRDKEFNADVSHELRTPLAVIRSATELLLAQPDISDKTKTRLDRIERAARQSTELTEALLHLVRSERTAERPSEYHHVDRIVEEVIDFKRPLIDRKPVEVSLIRAEPVLVNAPEAVIAVALGNLIGNAFKYTPSGNVDITVGNGRVVVEDTGPGLEESELQRVFTRHYRGSSATGMGSGLGLAIVQRFCELYGWDVEITPRARGGLRAELLFNSQ